MKIFIEGEGYNIEELEKVFNNSQFYTQHGYLGFIKSVGYYHSFATDELVFMLPKVFMKEEDRTVFGISKHDLIDFINSGSTKHSADYDWIRSISIYFYKSLLEFKNRFPDSELVNYSAAYQLKSTERTMQYSYLDIVLSFINFYKKNKSQILYKHIDAVKNTPKKPKWEKTVRKGNPVLISDNTSVYTQVRNKHKLINTEEELITYFFSIVNNFNEQHSLNIKIDKVYPLIRGKKFEELKRTGLNKLRKIKYRYFSDVLRAMHSLCYIYFSQFDSAKGKVNDDFIVIDHYNIVFEDMVDRLFSEELNDIKGGRVSIKELKYNEDGKIIDHIFDHRSLLDDSDIFYIGDSKYYKSNNEAGKGSRFKQFTYAKNVIQYNIDLLNDNKRYRANIRYRDEITEGYNITPNFFIYGYIDNVNSYEMQDLRPNGEVISSYHFEHRLFDRDTLFVHQYKINFLFVLKAYSSFSTTLIADFRNKVKGTFRDEFIRYFNNVDKCKYKLYRLKDEIPYENFMDQNFRLLNGKCFVTADNVFILAKHVEDRSDDLERLLDHFEVYTIKGPIT